jgi:methionyl-tRNA formyltransferase
MHSIMFCGTPDFAVPSLRALAADQAFAVGLVATQPDKPAGRSGALTPPPIKTVAHDLGIPVWQPQGFDATAAMEVWPQKEPPDFLVVVAYGHILDNAALALPRIAPINVHASLLPRWRGASPIQHAILAGDTQTGITVQVMARRLDAGPILAQSSTPISDRETAPSLHDRLSQMGATLLAETLKNPLQPQEQSEDGVTICRKLSRDDGQANAEKMDAATIDRMVRAFTPWPGITIEIDGATMKLLGTSLIAMPGAHPLPCKDNTTLWLVTVQVPGKKPMCGEEWARGRHK